MQLIVAPQLSSGRQHNYSTKTRQAGRANEQSMYSLMSIKNHIFFSPQLGLREVPRAEAKRREAVWDLFQGPMLQNFLRT
jgi:hypothetical protein